MIKKEDIFSPKSAYMINKLHHEIKLDDKLLVELQLPQDFKQTKIHLNKNQYPSQIRKYITPISEQAEEIGYSPNIFTALYEAVLNGFQHGNNYDPEKKLILSTKISPLEAEFIISDEGDVLHPAFSRFILEQRQKNMNGSFINWYKFSGEQKPDINNGTGTSFMHTYMDEIKYFRSSELGGLSLYLHKKNKCL